MALLVANVEIGLGRDQGLSNAVVSLCSITWYVSKRKTARRAQYLVSRHDKRRLSFVCFDVETGFGCHDAVNNRAVALFGNARGFNAKAIAIDDKHTRLPSTRQP